MTSAIQLLRTTFLSFLTLVLAGGLMVVQAQDTIIVDEDDPNNPNTISAGISNVDEDGDVVAVRAGGYNENLTVSTGFDFVIEARTDNDSGADGVEIDNLTIGDAGQTVTLRSDGTGFHEIDGSSTLTLRAGTFSIEASRDLQLQNGASVVRRAGGAISGSAPTFGSNVNVTYDLQDGDITAGLEAPADLGDTGTLAVEDNGTPDGRTVDFPSGRFGTFAANSFTINDDVRAEFAGDLSVESGVTVGPDQSLSVSGALEIEDDDESLTVNSDLSGNNDQVSVGSLTLNLATSGTRLSGSGNLVVDGAATFQVVSDTDGASDTFVESVTVNSGGDFEFGSIEETNTADGPNNTDETVVDINNSNGGTVTIAGGSFRQLINGGGGSTFEVRGDVTTDATGGNNFDNSGDGATIDISSGNTFTVVNNAPNTSSGSVTHSNSDTGGIVGGGTIRFESGRGESHVVNVSDNNATPGDDVNRFPNVVVAGGNGATFNGENGSADGNAIQVSGDLTGNASVTLSTADGGARVAGATTVSGGTTDLTGVTDAVSTADVVLNNAGTLNTNGNRLEVRRNFERNNSNAALATNGSSTVAFTSGGTDGTFDTETLFTINGTVLVDKPDATITIAEAVRVSGDVEIVDQGQFLSTTLRLSDNLFLQGGGQLTIDSNLDTEAEESVVFESAYTVAGDDTLGNAIVRGGSNITVNPTASSNTNDTSLEFDGSLELRNGGVTVAGGEDLSPAGPEAEVIRTLDGSGGQLINASAGGATFNGDGNGYDLTYGGQSADPTEDELTNDVVDLTVLPNTEPKLAEDVEVNGSLTVQNGSAGAGRISDDDPDADRTIELVADSTSHMISGQVEGGLGSTVNPVTIDVQGEGVTINGGSGSNSDAAVVENVLVSGAGATISGVQQIRGTLNVDAGDLELGLRAVDGADQVIKGATTVNDSLALASDVESTSGTKTDDIKVTSSGRINFATHTLSVTGGGADVDGDGGARYYSDGTDGTDGALLLDTNNGSILFGTDGEAVPRLVTVGGGTNVDFVEDSAVSEFLDVDAELDLGSSNLEVSGRVELAQEVFANSTPGGNFRAVGTTILIEGASSQQIQNFEVDSDTSTVNLVSADPDNPGNGYLEVDGLFTMTSGTLDYATDMVLTGSLASGADEDEFVYDGGDFVATRGHIELRSGGTSSPSNTVASFDIAQDSTLSIPNLRIRDDALLGDEQNLLVTSSLELFDTFETSSQGGRLVLADGATLDRQAPSAGGPGDANPNNDILDESIAFQSSNAAYNVEYSGSGQAITSGRELSDDPSRIQNLTIDRSGSDVFFEDNPSVLTGDVTVNGTLNLEDGELDYGRQLVVADSATVVRSGGALADVANGSTPDSDNFAPSAIDAPGFYTLVYEGTAGNLRATDREFLTGGNVALEARMGIPSSSPSGPTEGDVEIPFDRTVTALTVENQTDDSDISLEDTNPSTNVPSTITVTDSVTVTGGDLEAGAVINQGDLTVAGGEVLSTFDQAGNTVVSAGSFAGSLVTEADVLIGQNGSFSAGTLELDGTEQDLTLNGGPAAVGQLALSQQNGGDGRVYLSGDELVVTSNNSDAIDFNSGLLVVPDSVDQSEVLVELSSTQGSNTPGASIPFDRSDVDNTDPNDQSHIVGRVRVGVPSGTPQAANRGRFEFPVGTVDEYRPAALTFRTDDPTEVNTDIVIGQVPVNPGGTEGLPLEAGTDDQGDPVTIGENYPDLHWFVQATTGLGPSQEFDLELETGTSEFVGQFEDASELRIIRRFSGDAEQNQWRLQAGNAEGSGSEYDNTLIRRNNKEFVNIRTQSSTGGVSANAALYTVGVPTDVSADRFQIAGTVTYPTVENDSLTDGRALGGVEVQAVSSDTTLTDTTSSDGSFTIEDVSNGDYTIEANVTNEVSNVGSADALRTVRGFAGIDPFLSDFQREVADVTGDGKTNSSDALQIARFDIGAISSFQAGSWYSSQPTVTVNGGNQTGVTVRAAEYGDVRLDGGESSSSTNTVATASSQSAAATASTSGLRSVEMESGTFEVPVRVDGSATIGAYSLTLEVPTDKASFEGVASSDENVMTNAEDGTVKISWFDQTGDQPIELDDGATLVTLRFSAAEDVEEGTVFRPEITSGELSGADARTLSGATVQAAGIQIGSTAPDKFALKGNAPNPVSAEQTQIMMDMPERADVTVEVYNTLGQRIMTAQNEVAAGTDQGVQIDGSDLASGQYFYRVKVELSDRTVTKTGRMTVVK